MSSMTMSHRCGFAVGGESVDDGDLGAFADDDERVGEAREAVTAGAVLEEQGLFDDDARRDADVGAADQERVVQDA